MTKAPFALVAAAVLLAATAPAKAEGAQLGTPLPEKCRAEPADPSQPPSGERSDGAAKDVPADAPDTLTETLEPCNGVLAPPPVGDDGIAEPPPAQGRTPVIRPDDLPDAQSPSDEP